VFDPTLHHLFGSKAEQASHVWGAIQSECRLHLESTLMKLQCFIRITSFNRTSLLFYPNSFSESVISSNFTLGDLGDKGDDGDTVEGDGSDGSRVSEESSL
jgi:hypothetical protein